jgi:hypothetical protein
LGTLMPEAEKRSTFFGQRVVAEDRRVLEIADKAIADGIKSDVGRAHALHPGWSVAMRSRSPSSVPRGLAWVPSVGLGQ